ncbi:MAG: hypothetical protein GX666_03460 [Tissierellia bacterium]|nr:hypothetical protein [Tissierellia bacterium]
MSLNSIEDQIHLYAKILKIPTFASYTEVIRQMSPDSKFENLLLELMKNESYQRQENRNRKRLKAAGFPFH